MNSFDKLIESYAGEIQSLSPVSWAESNRILTKDISDYDGPLSYRMTPYLIKIANSFMEENPSQIISIMKGSQLGISIAGIFTILGWIMKESPGNILFITENDEKLKDQMQGPIDQMINHSGLADLVGSRNIRNREAKGRRNANTGDTLKGIAFPGGRLYTLSGQVISNLSSWSIKYGLYDEVERWKGRYKNAGDFLQLIEPRHRAFDKTRKLLFASTPEVKQTSNIEPLYELGDQQKYKIPCKCCGTMIELVWNKEVDGGNAGVFYEREKNGKYIEDSVRYVCQECGGSFSESHKYDMYEETYNAFKNKSKPICDWFPTSEPESYIYQSFHISSLYAPPGFYSWNTLARKWCEIHPNNKPIKIGRLQGFINQELGLTWEDKAKEVKANKLLKNGRSYEINTIPYLLSIQDGNGPIILITVAADLNGFEDDGRLDYEVVAWSQSGSSYSIDHGSIGTFERSKSMRKKQSENHDEKESKRIKWSYILGSKNNIFDEFKNTVMSKAYIRDDGKGKMRPPVYAIDTGHFTVHANAFVNSNPLCAALKGKSDEKIFKKFDQLKPYYEKSTKVEGLYLVNGNVVKDDLMDLMELPWNEKGESDQPDGFMNFPFPSGNKYSYKTFFHEFEGEKRELQINDFGTAIGARWRKKHSSAANHFWDCRVYNMAAKSIIVEKFCKAAKLPVSWNNFISILKR